MSTFINTKAIKVFIAEMIDAMPYLKASMPHFADQLSGKKSGSDYTFVLRDSGHPTDGLAITGSDRKTIIEKEVKLTLAHKKSVVEVTLLEAIKDIGDFKTEVADTYAVRLGAEVQSDVIARTFFKATVATYPKTGSNGWSALSKASAHLKGARNGAKLFGHLSSNASANLTVDALNGMVFIPSKNGEMLFGENDIGRFGGVEYADVTNCPTVTVPAATAFVDLEVDSASTTTGVGTLLIHAAAGNTSVLPAGLPLVKAGAYACNSVGMPTDTPFSFILQSPVTLNGITPVSATVQSLIPEDIGARNIYIAGVTTPALIAGALTCPLTAEAKYDVAQIRCNDVMNWDNNPLPDLQGAKCTSATVGGVSLKVTEFGDGTTFSNITRWDIDFLAGIADERLVACAYLPRD